VGCLLADAGEGKPSPLLRLKKGEPVVTILSLAVPNLSPVQSDCVTSYDLPLDPHLYDAAGIHRGAGLRLNTHDYWRCHLAGDVQ